ncbi:phosphoribosyl-ATP diphosphatase [Listeria seeligeri]|uniref:phosphoribosyl-ATP diphosphatase n=1 Tax=Listeria seeligeri TaxID=1640 RepID=UPI0016247ADA|nr:phosphoribosyl-ATP diphosphatase [Listeria seeligeri]MBC1764321.1 phosphoribosyl-ATP diphosphatase [Listeria seeligeri]MBC1882152.1 phosphoribosyl-ATP diphosphatase [Listeria seeligeri]
MLDKLYEEISLRKETPKEGSYTNYLFDKGIDKILKKVGEETTEVVIAAKNNDQELISEVSDLTYHLLVLLVEKNIPLTAIQAELEGRAGKLSTTRDRKEIDKL